MNCSECGKDHSVLPALWPVGARVESTGPLHYHTGNGNEVGKMPIGTMGQVMFHTDDGRPGIEFDGYPNSHTFHHPEDALRLVEMPPVDLQAEATRLRATITGLLGALDSIRRLAEAGAVCKPGTCEECDLLRTLRDKAEKAIEEVEAENG